MSICILDGDLDDPQVRALVSYHLNASRAATARESAHALDLEQLKGPDIQCWAAWDGAMLLGFGALRRLSDDHGEIKSMHTAAGHRRRGVATAILRHIIDAARALGMSRLSLETGSGAHFAPARELYQKHGFMECAPFAEYVPDANSVFLCRNLYP